jgi:hypothetical protein
MININKSTTQNDAPVVYGDSIDLLMNSMTYEPMFMLAILPVAAMGAIASVIDDDAARWINGASKDIMDVQNADLPAPIIVISNVSVLLTVVAMNSGALEATTSPPRTRYPRMNGVTVPNATHVGLKVRRMILGTGLQRLMMILLHT